MAICAPGRGLSILLHHTTPSRGGFQDNGCKYLHYVDSPAKFEVRSGLEDLPDRIEIAAISQISTGTCTPLSSAQHNHVDLPTSHTPSPLSFSLLTANEGSLADHIATDQSTWADWTDGLNMLRRDGGHVTSDETAGYIRALTEIGLKIKLLGTYPSTALNSLSMYRHRRPYRRKSRYTQWTGGWSPSFQHGLFLLRPALNICNGCCIFSSLPCKTVLSERVGTIPGDRSRFYY